MRKMCLECGRDVDDDMDFCPYCGCTNTVSMGDGGIVSCICPSCGASCGPMDAFCGKCGAEIPRATVFFPRLRRNGRLAIVVALITGFFNIFGIGHFILRQYLRGTMFLVITVVIWYLNDWTWRSTSFYMLIVCLAAYFYQSMDILRYAYGPEERWTGRRNTGPRHWTGSSATRLPCPP